jgi:hypothetical protein
MKEETEKFLNEFHNSEILLAFVNGIFKNRKQRELIKNELINRGLEQYLSYATIPLSNMQFEIFNAHKDFDAHMIFSPDGIESYAICSDGLVRIKKQI